MGLGHFSKTVKHHGGVIKCIKALYLRDSLKHGKLVGTDKYGNRYYENNDYFFLRNRWVEYADHVGLNYDASQIPPEWFGWMHHRTDLPPEQEPFRPKYPWILPHEENMSGTALEYVPWTTTRPKIEAWVPPESCGEGRPPRGDCENRPPVCHKEEEPPSDCSGRDRENYKTPGKYRVFH